MLPLSPAEIAPTGTSDYHWTPANQRAFLEHLAITGIASHAAQAVAMSKNSAYRLRFRRDGLAFSIGWEAALMVARGRLIDGLMERAMEGYTETATRSEDGREITRFKQDTRLAMAMVNRFDKRIDGPFEALPASALAFARIVSQDFEAFLDLIENGGGAAQMSLFLAARSDLASVLSGSHLAQISGDYEDGEKEETEPETAAEEPEPTPEEEAATMSVWFDDEADEWRTDFPPPPGFADYEEGEFGNGGYERCLSEEETRIQVAVNKEEVRPLREAAMLARERWFAGEIADRVRAEIAEEEAALEAAIARQRNDAARARVEVKAAVPDSRAEPEETEHEEQAEAEAAPRDEPEIDMSAYNSIQYYGNTSIPLDAARQMGMGRRF